MDGDILLARPRQDVRLLDEGGERPPTTAGLFFCQAPDELCYVSKLY